MSLEKTEIKNERPPVLTVPKVRPPDDRDIVRPSADTKAAPSEDR